MSESNAAVDMENYLPEESGSEDYDEIKGLDFGNELPEDVDPTDAAIDHLIDVADKAEQDEDASEEEAPESVESEEEVVAEDDDEYEYEYVVEEDEAVDEAAEAKKHMIPKRRLDDVVAKQRKAEQEAAELRKELAEALAKAQAIPAIDVRALSKQHSDINDQIIAATKQTAPEPIDMDALEARVEAKMELKSTLTSVFKEYPQLDTDSDVFDEDLNAEALVFQSAYLNQGYLPAEAVRRAANAAVRVVRPELLTETVEPKAAVKTRKTNVKGNVEASNAQPPKMNQGESGGKTSSEMVDITKLTDEEFDALPEATRARMRGDLV